MSLPTFASRTSLHLHRLMPVVSWICSAPISRLTDSTKKGRQVGSNDVDLCYVQQQQQKRKENKTRHVQQPEFIPISNTVDIHSECTACDASLYLYI